jgi:hypothetical protein
MKNMLVLILNFQLMNAPFAAELGQRPENQNQSILSVHLSDGFAKAFEEQIRINLQELQTKGPDSFLAKFPFLAEQEDEASLRQLKKALAGMLFNEKKPGYWEFSRDEIKAHFSLTDLWLGQVIVNGKRFEFAGKSFSQVHSSLDLLLSNKKTTQLKKILDNTFFISEAVAGLPSLAVLALAGFTFAAYMVRRVYSRNLQNPRETAAQFNEVLKDLNLQANQCENSKRNSDAYRETFKAASEIAGSSTLSSMASVTGALSAMIKSQIEDGYLNPEDCFNSLYAAGKKIGASVPDVNSTAFKRRKELLQMGAAIPNSESNTDALIGLCNSYNRLSSCMSEFVQGHINGSDMGIFKDRARENFNQYQRRRGSTRQ